MVHGPNIDLPDPDRALGGLSPEFVTVGPDGFPGLPAVRPRGLPRLPFER